MADSGTLLVEGFVFVAWYAAFHFLAIKPKIGTLSVVANGNYPDDGFRRDPINDLIRKAIKVSTAKVPGYDLICLRGSQYSHDFRF